MRTLAYQIFTSDAKTACGTGLMGEVSGSAYEKLRQSLENFAGVASVHSMVTYALAMAQQEDPELSMLLRATNSELNGTVKINARVNTDMASACKAEILLITCILAHFEAFLGRALLLSLLRNAWPQLIFKERSSESGRKA